MDIFSLSRTWFDFCFENPEKIRPAHTALYFFCIEHCNRLGWKEKFGLPTGMAKEAIGIHSYTTYIATLNDLVEWGFIKMVQKSVNQYSSNIIALPKFVKAPVKAPVKALDKAMLKHMSKQKFSTGSIDIHETIKQETLIHETIPSEKKSDGCKNDFVKKIIDEFCRAYENANGSKYELVSIGKERAAAEKLLKIYKTKYPEAGSDEILTGLYEYFQKTCAINDNWLKTNMSLSIIVSKFNEINNKLKHGNGNIDYSEIEAGAKRFADLQNSLRK